ncbi:MAG: DUF417 family protein [Chitinophagales bacterium]
MRKFSFHSLGYVISVLGVAIVLIWIGIFKFTLTEAKAIEPLVRNHPLMRWMYGVTSVQAVSNIIGTVEIVAAVFLLLHFFWRKAGIIGGVLGTLIFLCTLSFLFTTPDMVKKADGMTVTDFFILKDVIALGVCMMVIGKTASKS